MRKPNLPASRRVIAMRDRRNKIPWCDKLAPTEPITALLR